MGASVLSFVAPPDSKVVEEMLLQLALWMYVDKGATLLWAEAVMLVSELLVEYMRLLLLLLWLWWWWL